MKENISAQSAYGFTGEEKLRDILLNLTHWLVKSFAVNVDKGSSAYQYIWGYWSKAYPETTAYIIPSLMRLYAFYSKESLMNLALAQKSYFSELQLDNGAYKRSKKDDTLYFFDNAQILGGLAELNAWRKNDPAPNLEKCYSWLLSQVNNNGLVEESNFIGNITPSYYSRALWKILNYEKENSIPYSGKLLRLYERIWNRKNDTFSFQNWSFDGNPRAHTHTIVYTLRGLYESALLVQDKDREQELKKIVLWIYYELMKKGNESFYGMYDTQWNADRSFICSAGNAQLALLVMRIQEVTGFDAAREMVSCLAKPIINASSNTYHRAVPSSLPFWGRYNRFKYTNWTQKFVIDMILQMIENSKNRIE